MPDLAIVTLAGAAVCGVALLLGTAWAALAIWIERVYYRWVDRRWKR